MGGQGGCRAWGELGGARGVRGHKARRAWEDLGWCTPSWVTWGHVCAACPHASHGSLALSWFGVAQMLYLGLEDLNNLLGEGGGGRAKNDPQGAVMEVGGAEALRCPHVPSPVGRRGVGRSCQAQAPGFSHFYCKALGRANYNGVGHLTAQQTNRTGENGKGITTVSCSLL